MIRTRVLAIALATLATACAAQGPTPEPARIAVPLTEFSFGSTLIEAPAGRPIRLALANSGAVDHDLVIDQLVMRVLVRAGESGTVTFGPVPAGSYAVHCSIPMHRELGMTAVLVVR